MSELELIALLGFHDRGLCSQYSGLFQDHGYQVDLVPSYEAMLAKIRQRYYRIIFMDLNLGSPASSDITPAVRVYEAVRDRIESQKAKFLGISGNTDAVKAAEERGIPALAKGLIIRKVMEFFEIA